MCVERKVDFDGYRLLGLLFFFYLFDCLFVRKRVYIQMYASGALLECTKHEVWVSTEEANGDHGRIRSANAKRSAAKTKMAQD